MRVLNAPLWSEERLQQHEKVWDFTEQPTRLTASAVVTAGANANDDVAAFPFFCTGARPVLVTDAFATPNANSTGIDANNTSAWVVNGAGNAIATKTHASDVAANTSYNMGAITTGYLAANTIVTFAITNGTAADLNSAVVCATIGYLDASALLGGLKVIATDGGGVTISDGENGILAITPSDASAADNDEIYLCTDTELFKFVSGNSFEAEAYLKYSEANTDDANIFFGFMNAFAANAIVDDGAGPKATGDYVGFWKIDGGTQWYCGAQANGTATPTVDALGVPNTTSASTSYFTLHIKVVCLTSTRAQATFSVDGVCIASIEFAYASATEMQVGIGVKNGSANAETVNLDYLGYATIR